MRKFIFKNIDYSDFIISCKFYLFVAVRDNVLIIFLNSEKFIDSVRSENHFLLIGKDEGLLPVPRSLPVSGQGGNGLVYHVCVNDPGLFQEPEKWLSAASAPLSCCKECVLNNSFE